MLTFKRMMHIQHVMNSARLATPYSSLTVSQLKAILRFMRSPSHLIFLASNFAILVHLHYLSTQKTNFLSRDKVELLEAQLKEIERLEGEEKMLRNEIRKQRLRRQLSDRWGSRSASLARSDVITLKKQVRSIDNKYAANKFHQQRLAISRSVQSDLNVGHLFRKKSHGPNWEKLLASTTLLKPMETTHIRSSSDRNKLQALLHCLVGVVLKDSRLRPNSNIGLQFEAFYESLSGHHLTYEASDVSKYIRSSRINTGLRDLTDEIYVNDKLESAFELFEKQKDARSKGILLLLIARALLAHCRSGISENIMLLLFQKFGNSKLPQFQSFLVNLNPQLDFFQKEGKGQREIRCTSRMNEGQGRLYVKDFVSALHLIKSVSTIEGSRLHLNPRIARFGTEGSRLADF